MARPYIFPDVKDRSINSPSVIVSPRKVLGNFNKINNESRVQVTDVVKKWFIDEAMRRCWTEAIFHGNQCALSVNLKIDNQ